MSKPTYLILLHGLEQRYPTGFVLDMTILESHEASGAPTGTRGNSSLLLSIDFERGIAITLNSIYQFK